MECQQLAAMPSTFPVGGALTRMTKTVPEKNRRDTNRSDAPPSSSTEMEARKAAILNAVVSEYIATAQPVGSQHVVHAPGVSVSSATVRSDMAALERDGFLAQPHTSAGRIPTDKGYRFFVDQLGGSASLDTASRQQVRTFFDRAHGEIEEMLNETSGLLANLTDCTAMVVGPTHESSAVRSLQIVGLGPRLALLVVVLADGAVQKQSLEFAEDVDEATLHEAALLLSGVVVDHTLDQHGPVPTIKGRTSLNRVVQVALGGLDSLSAAARSDQLFVGGSSRMATAFDAVDTVRSVLTILEQQLVVVSLLRDILDTGLSVAIGTEHGLEPLASCAIVVAPVSVEGQEVGTIGLLGPTRMNYPLALAAARVVGDQLGQHLAEGSRSEGNR